VRETLPTEDREVGISAQLREQWALLAADPGGIHTLLPDLTHGSPTAYALTGRRIAENLEVRHDRDEDSGRVRRSAASKPRHA
jgi:hypothetical protein